MTIAARLVWGSDWPHTRHRRLIDYDASRDALDRWISDASLRASSCATPCARHPLPLIGSRATQRQAPMPRAR
jgi:hypothetical protein